MHLLLPLLASILLVCGLILIKRAGQAGVDTITTLFVSNIFSSIAFAFLWFLGGVPPDWSLIWQPIVIALLYCSGLTFTFLAVGYGDVSIATPVLGIKVVFVALLLTLFGTDALPGSVWLAALMAATGIAMIQWTGRSDPQRALITIGLAVMAASSFATFDVLVQTWSPSWNTGRLLPITYAFVGVFSLGLLPWIQWTPLREASTRRLLLGGAGLVALQALCIVLALSLFGDAARVNVVYALRALWGVLLAWLAARIWGGAEADHSNRVMVTRGLGAGLLTIAVILVIVA